MSATEPESGVPLLLVEDDDDIAAMTSEMLAEVYDVDRAPDAEEGLRFALRRHYEVVVVDRRLPGMDGVGLVKALRRARIRTPVLMLTALGTVEDRISGLDGGANDYLVKPFDFGELTARLRALRRGFAADGDRRRLGDWEFTPHDRTMYSPMGGRVLLTATESALVELLSTSPDHVFSREELLTTAFGPDDKPGTVDAYVHYVRRKTDRDVIETVRGHGYRAGAPL
ncbi:response regulator transcription factor [Xylanimonas sp. McL0601]|uniref:response regulator transcription factor n=1 Tax=Xylanimonas sp. McL0601 TaxID=3414739 RepID=UPI003CF0FA0F